MKNPLVVFCSSSSFAKETPSHDVEKNRKEKKIFFQVPKNGKS
jgi:hypothetical protein